MGKIGFTVVLIALVLPALMINLGNCSGQNNAVPYNYNELSAQIKITSPKENISYSSHDIVVNVNLYVGSHEPEIGSRYIPYQNISCVYSLDGSDWQNLSLVSISNLDTFPSTVNNFWYTTMWLNYTIVLHNVSEGSHYLNFDVTPNAIYFSSYSYPETTSVHFEVHTSVINLNDIVAIGLIIAVIISVSSVIYVKKNKNH